MYDNRSGTSRPCRRPHGRVENRPDEADDDERDAEEEAIGPDRGRPPLTAPLLVVGLARA